MRKWLMVFLPVFGGCQTTGERDATRLSAADPAVGVTVETCAIDGAGPFMEIYNGPDFAVIRSLGVEPPTIVAFRSDGSLSGQIRKPATAISVAMMPVFQKKVRIVRDAVRALEPEGSDLRRWVDANVVESDDLGTLPQATAEVLMDLDGRGRPAGTFTVTGGSEFAEHLLPPIKIPQSEGTAMSRFPLRVRFATATPGGRALKGGEPQVQCSAPLPVSGDAVPVSTMATSLEGKKLQESMHMMAAASADLALSIGFLTAAGKTGVDETRIEQAARLFCAPFSRIAAERYKDGPALEKGTAEFLSRHPGFSQWRDVVDSLVKERGLPGDTLDRALWNGCAAAARPELRS